MRTATSALWTFVACCCISISSGSIPAADFDAAARIYRRCCAVGFTPRGMVDCMIAAVAWRNGASLLAQDPDLQPLGQIVGIELDRASGTI